MSKRCEEEFNPWPSFVDIFSSVILVMLLFLLITLVNLGYYAQFKYKVSYTGSIATEDMVILNNNRSSEPNEPNTTKVTDPTGGHSNSDINVKIIKEQQQELLLLKKQLSEKEFHTSEKKTESLESAGIDVADLRDKETDRQKIFEAKDYLIITYKDNEVFIDDVINRKVKQFLSKAKDNAGKHRIEITAEDIKGQISATIAKQISLARTISTRNLIRKFGYEKRDVKVNLQRKVAIKEKINDKNGYLVISIIK